MTGGAITQRVERTRVQDLVDRPPRAALAFATDDGPQCLPVAVREVDGQTIVQADRAALPATGLPDRATLLVDDGRYWFELRALVRRGSLEPDPRHGTADAASFALVDDRVVAWDYSQLREEPLP